MAGAADRLGYADAGGDDAVRPRFGLAPHERDATLSMGASRRLGGAMPREEKQGRRAFLGEAGRSAGPTASRAGGEAGGSSYAAPAGRTSRHDAPPRWFAAGAASDEPPAAPGTPATAYAAPFFV